MKLIWKIFVRDVRQATRNVIAVIVAMGLAIVPALYAWYNIAASWDPYGNTKALKVAVANVDKGYKSDLMPITINVGEWRELRRILCRADYSKELQLRYDDAVFTEDQARQARILSQ